MKTRLRVAVATVVLAAACTSKQESADTLRAPDTVKPAPADTMRRQTDSNPTAGPTGTTTTTTTTKTTTTKTTTTGTTAARDTNLGRDSVIRFPLNDPRHRIPVVKKDSTKPPR